MGLRHFRTEIYFRNLMYFKNIYNLWLIICWDLMFNVVMFLICNALRTMYCNNSIIKQISKSSIKTI